MQVSERSQRGVQRAHELGHPVPARWRGGIAPEHRDKSGRRLLSGVLDLRCSDTSISARGQLGRVRREGRGTKDVPDLGRPRERMQVGRTRGMTRGACCLPSDLGRRFPRGRMRGQCACSLHLGARSTLNESPRRFHGCVWASIVRVTCLEERQGLLSAFRRIAGYGAEVLHTQLDPTDTGRHVLIVSELATRPGTARATAARGMRREAPHAHGAAAA